MPRETITAESTIIFDGIPLNDFPHGKIIDITYDDNFCEQKIGKNGNVMTVYKPAGKKTKTVMRTLRTGDADLALLGLLTLQNTDFVSTGSHTLIIAKRFGDMVDTLTLSNLHISKAPAMIDDLDGDMEQEVAQYEFTSGSYIRVVA